MSGEDGFIGRWSRLKHESRDKPEEAAAVAPVPEVAPPPAEKGEAPPDLPDISALTKDSDFSVFLRAGVPAELQRQALRVLWRSDPVLANLDGLVDYADDYTGKGVAEVVRTAYRVGQGYIDAVERKEKGDAPEAEAAEVHEEVPTGDNDLADDAAITNGDSPA